MESPQKIGRYEILDELGHGAMGTVYRAKDPSMDRVVALKTIISVALIGEKENEFRERFYREARAAGALAHPGIVPVFDIGEHEGSPFLVMEFVEGKTLADMVKKGERLTLDRVCELGQKIAEALGYAHRRGVVHRDIKPANILLTSKELHGIARPKISDFGVAKLAAGHTTLTGQMLGTPAFMPPEQFTGAPIDGRADLFSLGVVLYWMSTGEQPFPGESMTAVSYKVVNIEPVPPRKLNPSIPAKLENIILKCLAKSPDERYQTGEELAQELGEARGKGATLQNAAATQPSATGQNQDTDQTFIEAPRPIQTMQTAQAGQPVQTSPDGTTLAPASSTNKSKSKTSFVFIFAAVIAIAVVTSGFALWRLRHKAQSPAQVAVNVPPAVTDAPTAAANALPPPVLAPSAETTTAEKPVVVSRPASTASPNKSSTSTKATKTQTDTTAKTQDTPPPPTPAAPALPPPVAPAMVEFNPKTLDAKTNAKLRIECDHIPAALDFILEMNGKVYLKRSAEGFKTVLDDFYVPPGVQEFRVTAESNGVKKISNTVSSEFKSKKRHTLKIELRTQGAGPNSGVPQGLYPDTQLVLTLK